MSEMGRSSLKMCQQIVKNGFIENVNHCTKQDLLEVIYIFSRHFQNSENFKEDFENHLAKFSQFFEEQKDSQKGNRTEKLDAICKVCGDSAKNHNHYGSIVCYPCRAFFRRESQKTRRYSCINNDKNCQITAINRKLCPFCRYEKCIREGMKPNWIMTEMERREAELKKKNKIKQITSYEKRMK